MCHKVQKKSKICVDSLKPMRQKKIEAEDGAETNKY